MTAYSGMAVPTATTYGAGQNWAFCRRRRLAIVLSAVNRQARSPYGKNQLVFPSRLRSCAFASGSYSKAGLEEEILFN